MIGWLPDRIFKRMPRNPMNDPFADLLVNPFDPVKIEQVTDRSVRWILFVERWRWAIEPYIRIFKLMGEVIRGRYWRASKIEPYIRIFKLMGEVIYGKYWRASKEVHSGANPASGAGAGASSQPVAQFTSYATTPAGTGGVAVPPPNLPRFFEDAGIKAGEVIAYRAWRLKNGKLYSMYMTEVCWEPGEILEGDAERGDGIYGFKSVLLLAQYGKWYSDAQTPVVTGTVDLWGEVYEHERGYRASKAAVRSIDDSREYDAKALRKLYGLTRSRKKKAK